MMMMPLIFRDCLFVGGTNASTLSRTRELIGAQGKTFSNWFVQTPQTTTSFLQTTTAPFLQKTILFDTPMVVPQHSGFF